MIEIGILKKGKRIKTVSIKGHAYSSDETYDLMCNTVSTLFIALANGLEEVAGGSIEVRAESGDSLLEVTERDTAKLEKMDILLSTFEFETDNLSQEYPEFIKTEKMEDKDD